MPVDKLTLKYSKPGFTERINLSFFRPNNFSMLQLWKGKSENAERCMSQAVQHMLLADLIVLNCCLSLCLLDLNHLTPLTDPSPPKHINMC